jgi:hypothetical protein
MSGLFKKKEETKNNNEIPNTEPAIMPVHAVSKPENILSFDESKAQKINIEGQTAFCIPEKETFKTENQERTIKALEKENDELKQIMKQIKSLLYGM